ncbi:MAG: hypothetical protein SGILL_006096 [Bacillariaceae sp.]
MAVDFATVNAVDNSWNIIRNIPNYEQVAGEILFRKIFELAPGALGLFQFGAHFEDGPEEELYQHPIFINHAKGVVSLLDVAVNLLGPDMVPVTIALKDLGARHVEYGVLPPHYDVVGEALLYTLETALGDAWTEPVKQGWIGVYTFVSTTMIEGAKEYLIEKVKKERAAKIEAVAEVQKNAENNSPHRNGSRSSSLSTVSSDWSRAPASPVNKLPVVKKSRRSLHSVLTMRRGDGSKSKKIPNSRVENRSIVTWLDKALKITRT